MKLKIATSQFAVSSDILKNKRQIVEQMKAAGNAGARLIHFPEGSLSGYAGIDFDSFVDYPFDKLRKATYEILKQAGELRIWVILGSAHPLNYPNKPHNCIYIISDTGQLVDRYDKRFCAGSPSDPHGELAHFSPGDHPSFFSVNGIRCATAICHEYRYPELYREFVRHEVQVVFHSFHAARMDENRKKEMEDEVGKKYHVINPGTTLPEITMPSTMISYAANNYLWISCSNSSAQESCWGSFAVRPDGVIEGRLVKNTDDILFTMIDTGKRFYDATKDWRKRAMQGIFHSGETVKDPRSSDRYSL